MLIERQQYPLGNVGALGRTSLAGIQPKIVLARTDGWCRVEGGFPSTHIVKPQLERFPTVIFDEEYGARILRRLGLMDYSVEIIEFAGLPSLVVERFDRDDQIAGGRLHQEDFSQALGASGVQKYQGHGCKETSPATSNGCATSASMTEGGAINGCDSCARTGR
ncbi:MAG: HipA domain-containing protein [Propionibacteriaceae bacterium]|nr:HipA domain-containing protein [Propionibacteriaceae bacterium]